MRIQRLAPALLAIACSSHALAGTTWLVSNNPAENPDFPGLWEALHSPLVVAGDTIEMSQGLGPYQAPRFEHYEIVNRGLIIRAQPGERPVLRVQVESNTPLYTLVLSGGAETIIEGIQISNAGQFAMSVNGSPTLRGCYFQGVARSSVIQVAGDTLFDSCEFRGIGGLFGNSISISGEATFLDCLFTQNPNTSPGIGVNGFANFIGCDFIANQPAIMGAEIDSTGTLLIDRCRFIDTSTPVGFTAPIIRSSGQTTIVNTVFSGSGQPTRPLLLLTGGVPQFHHVVNCTFEGNTAASIIQTDGLAAAVVHNCIIWNNTLTGTPFNGTVVVAHSNIQGGYAGTGNISINPAFKAAGQDDYRLNGGSPCIDRADASAIPPGITLDAGGKPRFFDDPATSNNNAAGSPPFLDMGAYEYQGPFVCIPDLTTTANPFAAGFGTPNGILNNDDFFYYLLLFENANPQADMTATAIPGTPGYGTPNGVINNDDFFYFVMLFAAGCNP